MKLIKVFVAFILTLCSTSAFCIYLSRADGGGVKIEGAIEPGDYEKFLKFIRQDFDNYIAFQNKVYLNSPGGDVVEAIRISNLLKTAYSSTLVANNGYCFSSCFLIWAGGAIRMLPNDGKLGIHRITLSRNEVSVLAAEKVVGPASKSVEEYLLSTGIPRNIVDKMNETSSADIFIMDNKWLIKEGYVYSIMFPPTFIDLAQKQCGPNVLVRASKNEITLGPDDVKNWLLCVNEFKKKNQGVDFKKILRMVNPDSPLAQ